LESRDAQISAVAALDEPIRRRLYDDVIRQAKPVSRDEAAAAVGPPCATAALHLDQLVEEDAPQELLKSADCHAPAPAIII
jgi:predicted ArsR family transcriptional regulator